MMMMMTPPEADIEVLQFRFFVTNLPQNMKFPKKLETLSFWIANFVGCTSARAAQCLWGME